ncbi:dolichyl-P-Man:Man(5)GlcNAc(2)-PP-dolichol alpha-1,3-mannosyltransferase [Dimargaris verticillata]|uniref:Dol-P-Man:Man(5)GlcNAc(2)-PP-Dol alpha-1,3-mannosyltransferase n=1 Tax=Dimargaris verticillata TaxID=2761393 RepID=A0A9W8AXW3_9FUNG|nr:dolichyl-P-Man:Man(5)GlcNAc(2)-PP-dolichol alpha-1,3-mannosyltransferase [Dimargaris verticillata]
MVHLERVARAAGRCSWLQWPRRLLLVPTYAPYTAGLLLLGEALLLTLIIYRVPYTEIDWTTYMQQVSQFLAGERDYGRIGGATGPLVYPAGFLYVYSAMAWLTNAGAAIRVAQGIFAGLYLASLALVMRLYCACMPKVPPWYLVALCLSRRLHSIFVLRLFNDPIAMMAVYASMLCLLQRRWELAMLGYSLGLSVKMNVLLFAPGFAFVLYACRGLGPTCRWFAQVGLAQMALGLPFLWHAPTAYLGRAFDFGRAFLFKWTVNWKFLGPELFASQTLSQGLLVAHLVTLLGFALFKWCREEQFWSFVWSRLVLHDAKRLSRVWYAPDYLCLVLFTSNFVGICFARSLHYQFYAWYYWSLPLLLWSTRTPLLLQ